MNLTYTPEQNAFRREVRGWLAANVPKEPQRGPGLFRAFTEPLRNRERSDHDKPFWLVDHVELLHEATPEPGDLICFNRVVNGVMTHHSYTSLRREFWENGHENDPVTGSSHCALVVGSGQNPDGTHFVETIGGNETHSVRIRHVPVDANGNIANPAALNVFGMIKLVGC